MSDIDNYRRRFMTGVVGVAATVSLPAGLLFWQTAEGKSNDDTGLASAKTRWGMLIDTTKCATGCDACVSGCDKENGLSGNTSPTSPQWIRKVQVNNPSTGNGFSLPMMCQHCEEPPCVDVCPTGASFKRVDGIVLVDRHICIGCRYCMMACPYKARSFIHHPETDQLAEVPRGQGCVESCTFCVQRIDEGKTTTACQDACNAEGHQAIYFGDLKDPNSEISKQLAQYSSQEVLPNLDLHTGVRYQGI
jgi:molybdopterin-containing oxidoreductase family iron-sulfur binding subunit